MRSKHHQNPKYYTSSTIWEVFFGQSSAPHYQVAKSSRANFACRFQLTAGVLQLKVASMTT
jgi:dihydroorotase